MQGFTSKGVEVEIRKPTLSLREFSALAPTVLSSKPSELMAYWPHHSRCLSCGRTVPLPAAAALADEADALASALPCARLACTAVLP